MPPPESDATGVASTTDTGGSVGVAVGSTTCTVGGAGGSGGVSCDGGGSPGGGVRFSGGSFRSFRKMTVTPSLPTNRQTSPHPSKVPMTPPPARPQMSRTPLVRQPDQWKHRENSSHLLPTQRKPSQTPSTPTSCKPPRPSASHPKPIATPLLANVVAAIGKRFTLDLKPGFVEPAVLWSATVAAPSRAASAAKTAADFPVTELQFEAISLHGTQTRQYQLELERWQGTPRDIRRKRPQSSTLEHFHSSGAANRTIVEMLDTSHGIALHQGDLAARLGSFGGRRGALERQRNREPANSRLDPAGTGE